MATKKSKNISTPVASSENRSRKWSLLVFVGLFATLSTALLMQTNAAPRNQAISLSLSPTSSKLAVGDNLAVSILVNTGSKYANAVQANLTYPTSIFEFVSIDTSGSAYEFAAEAVGGEGNIRIARASTLSLSGSQFLGIVNLRARAPTRNANITFTSGSAIINPDTTQSIMTKTIGGKYTVN